MTDTHRLYLEVAALLHDIGSVISFAQPPQAQLLFDILVGTLRFTQAGVGAYRNIARYHRRTLPQHSHPSFFSLNRDERMIVSKLAAILRVANALDKDQLQKVMDLKIRREGDRIALIGQNVSDLAMGKLALAAEAIVFTEIFGKKSF